MAIDLSDELPQAQFSPSLVFSAKASTYWIREWLLGTVLTSQQIITAIYLGAANHAHPNTVVNTPSLLAISWHQITQ